MGLFIFSIDKSSLNHHVYSTIRPVFWEELLASPAVAEIGATNSGSKGRLQEQPLPQL